MAVVHQSFQVRRVAGETPKYFTALSAGFYMICSSFIGTSDVFCSSKVEDFGFAFGVVQHPCCYFHM